MHRAYLALVPILLLLSGCAAPAQASISASAPMPAPQSDVITTTPSSFIGPTAQQNYTKQPEFQPVSVHQLGVLVAANLRAGPGVNYTKVGSVQPGACLNSDGSSVASDGTWFHIVSGEWIRGDLVGECEDTGGGGDGRGICVNWTDASSYVGQTMCVCGPVVNTNFATYTSGQPTFLDVGRKYPSSSRFAVLIWGRDRGSFPGAPESIYLGKNICATGLVENYGDHRQIQAKTASQIQIQ